MTSVIALCTSLITSQPLINAAKTHGVPIATLVAIAYVETKCGHSKRNRRNKNGTHDIGLFQINSVNHEKCRQFGNLNYSYPNMVCAAYLLSVIKTKGYKCWRGRYHSNTPRLKLQYDAKIKRIEGIISHEL